MDRAAAKAGLNVGMALPHARSLVPDLEAVAADPAADDSALEQLADWALRYTPWVARWDVDNDHGLMLDITGCAHLFGSESLLVDDLVRRLRNFGIAARAAVADTPGAAWAWARYGKDDPIIPTGAARKILAPLPPAALRLDAETAAELERLGLRTVGDLIDLPRAPLATRFGKRVAERIGQLIGKSGEPISPRQPVPVWQTRLPFPEPIVHLDAVVIALDRLLAGLCPLLAREHQGARALTLALYRLDGSSHRVSVATSRASRDPAHLKRLFMEKLDKIDAGFGIETAVLAATRVEAFSAEQMSLEKAGSRGSDVAPVIDSLKNRLGAEKVVQAVPQESHIPERAVSLREAPALFTDPPRAIDRVRPISLLATPESIEAMALVPDHPPLSFVWRRVAHRVARAEGPERIAPEWWRAEQIAPVHRRPRDYYRVEDITGRRYWIFREGLYDGAAATPPRWYMHGLFG